MKDWTERANSLYKKALVTSFRSKTERELHDYYATDPEAVRWLLRIHPLDPRVPVWEPAAGEDHLAGVLREAGYDVRTSDIVARMPPPDETLDFLGPGAQSWDGNIVTNPPFRFATEFVQRALSLVPDGRFVCMFLRLLFLEGQRRRELFRLHPPKTVFVSSSRLLCARNGDFREARAAGGSSVAYAWFIWQKGYKGNTTIKWFN